jgi:hypothetical protein
MVTNHSVELSELRPATQYAYLVKSKNANGKESSTQPGDNYFVTAPQQNLKVGQSAWNAHKSVTLESATRTPSYSYQDPSSGLVTKRAPTGKIFIIVDALVENTGTEIVNASSMTFSMSDAHGLTTNPISYPGNDAFDYMYVTLNPGQNTGGKILFEVAASATGLKLAYDFGTHATGSVLATWALTFT